MDNEDFNETLEQAYWNFDARKKGYGQWQGRPMSERDAFKATVRGISALLTRRPGSDVLGGGPSE